MDKINKEELKLEEVNTDEIVIKGRGKIKIKGEYVTASEIKAEEDFYVDANGYKYKKNNKGDLLINYINQDKTKTLSIVDFTEGDYGLWIEEEAPYYLADGKIIERNEREEGTKGEVLSLAENKFLRAEERIKDSFLWIYPQERIVFPKNKKSDTEKAKEESERAQKQASAKSSKEQTNNSNNKEDEDKENKENKNNKETRANSNSKTGKQLYVCSGAVLKCSCGGKTSKLQVVSGHNAKVCGNLIANIMDHQPTTNVPSFGYCKDPKNPCTPNLPSPWTKVKKDVKVGQYPALLEGSKLTCANGGQIEIVDPGQSILKE